MKKKIIIANWKLNGNIQLLQTLLKPLVNFYIRHKNKSSIKLVIMPPYVYLYPMKSIISHSSILLGSQNVDINLIGAFTGEVSINMLKDVGVSYVLVGHSERRQYHRENDVIIAKKFKIVKDSHLIPVLCIGETEHEYLSCKTEKICKFQIDAIFDLLGPSGFNNSVIAYEPKWAIGTNTIPSINFIQKILMFIQNYIFNKQNSTIKLFSLQYGGSVNEHNIIELYDVKNIDGFLVGSASLSLDFFKKLLNNC
ncbi:triosephosphate isomerase [Buchnera aphidicola str. Bp (Baizongia pistaciae)]|uniref:Triosephosphate isomerase n=1 Tax=Buchnera aphidicola subsp. Baizongia pistaciae (strain Bp) TaxID=224915 RepID=TPIS_BUCBP|nr:triose-phosphate isomerase [Buchnera aphidicola]P59462.1 RecName: Full=Triosephosphate isomerase; Short=TIM; Short=TPI; AltName: Full=Triose-phosphate isomerase [Buchnera aphidicola str. Bp (Baizongia pistaciae)]AAO27010.1 triosephosphate isomerase [Buchnera aphidicola str. Bp (Baizongia pistaciae)]